MKVFNFCCLFNDDCSNRGKNVAVQKEEPAEPEYCDVCGSEMKLLGELSVFSVGRFANMSNEDKRAVLKKRAHDHYVKEVEEKKRDMIKKVDKGLSV